MVNKILKA